MLAEIEQAISGQLTQKLGTEIAVEAFPARPNDYRLQHPRGVVLIAYAGSDFGPRQDIGLVVQDQTLKFMLLLMVRNLRTHVESLLLLDRLRRAITGFVPVAGARPCYLRAERFQQENNGIWTWEIEVRLEVPLVEDADSEMLLAAPYNLLTEAAHGAPVQQVTAMDGVAQVDIKSDDGAITVIETPREAPLCGSE